MIARRFCRAVASRCRCHCFRSAASRFASCSARASAAALYFIFAAMKACTVDDTQAESLTLSVIDAGHWQCDQR